MQRLKSLREYLERLKALGEVQEIEVEVDWNLEMVWAFATRCHPARDFILFPDEEVLPLVAWLSPEERKRARTAKVLCNGLSADDLPAESRPRRSSFRHLWPADIQAHVLRNWKHYGYPDA